FLITRDVVRAFLDEGIAGPAIVVRSDGRTIPRNARTLAFRRPIAARRTGPSRGAICSHPPRTHVARTAPIQSASHSGWCSSTRSRRDTRDLATIAIRFGGEGEQAMARLRLLAALTIAG